MSFEFIRMKGGDVYPDIPYRYSNQLPGALLKKILDAARENGMICRVVIKDGFTEFAVAVSEAQGQSTRYQLYNAVKADKESADMHIHLRDATKFDTKSYLWDSYIRYSSGEVY